ncbi:STAS domain-containing protein [Cohnella thailandensis]|uniref:Anti-sigma factor antagonist n=1 Tax=Cohnella thailandensis TaxID=557557 RepID=A0A841T123_9BACL|nr:STAS domain-containing protein [Cohnella thailandensis]MBB6637874.1 STAS domain-containing protein [Cohnella thailandensis]MBP1977418.1 anti-sigma B factor antagonist [Cohnella thailandensis]
MKTDKLSFRTENREGLTVIYLSGELDLEVASQMRTTMEPLVELADRKLVLNLKDLKYIDSTGIGILIGIVKARHARQAPFAVEEVSDHIRKLFDMTGISPFLDSARA